MNGAEQPSKPLHRLAKGRRSRPRRKLTNREGSGRDTDPLKWRLQHHPLGDGNTGPALVRTKIAGDGDNGDNGDSGPPAYPMRAGDTVDALEKKGRIDHKAAAGARKFEAIFQAASLQGLASRDPGMMPGAHNAHGGEPHRILQARDHVWAAISALGGIGTPGANIAWDVLGLGMTIKAHAQRCQFGQGRSLNPMTATGILVQACFTLAVHYGK